MKKFFRRTFTCGFLAVCLWSGFLISDKRQLHNGLIRFHVVANSDTDADQAIKLAVRDAVLESISADIQKIADIDEAKKYLQINLPKLQQLANQTLENLGFYGGSRVTLCKEPFGIRHYDTFSLPAGVYDSLRIVIGEGQGKNWWCVSFPSLCIPATTSGFAKVAVNAGFSEPLVQTLSSEEPYEIRFFLLNQLGKLENIFFRQ